SQTFRAPPLCPCSVQPFLGRQANLAGVALGKVACQEKVGTMHMRRIVLGVMTVLAVVLTGVGVSAFVLIRHAHAASSFVGVKSYYLGLGDSLAFGYEPNLDWTHGYVYQWYSNLQQHGSKSRTDYGCNGETTTTMINGKCPYTILLHNYHTGSQL